MTGQLERVRAWLPASEPEGAVLSGLRSDGGATREDSTSQRPQVSERISRVWALVTGSEAVLFSTNIEEPRLCAEEDLAGFELSAIPWYHPGGLAGAVAGRTRGQRLAADPEQLAVLRMPLTKDESERILLLGHDTAIALEGAVRAWHPGERECDLAARIAHLLPFVRLRGATWCRLPSSLLRRSSVQTAPRPFGSLTHSGGRRGRARRAERRVLAHRCRGQTGPGTGRAARGGMRGGGGDDRRDQAGCHLG